MATLATQSIKRAGLGPTYGAATVGGDQFTPDQNTFLHAKNGSGGALTITIVTPGSVLGDIAVADVAVSVPAGGERMIGPFPAQTFADPALAGKASITYSGVTSLTIAAIAVSQP